MTRFSFSDLIRRFLSSLRDLLGSSMISSSNGDQPDGYQPSEPQPPEKVGGYYPQYRHEYKNFRGKQSTSKLASKLLERWLPRLRRACPQDEFILSSSSKPLGLSYQQELNWILYKEYDGTAEERLVDIYNLSKDMENRRLPLNMHQELSVFLEDMENHEQFTLSYKSGAYSQQRAEDAQRALYEYLKESGGQIGGYSPDRAAGSKSRAANR